MAVEPFSVIEEIIIRTLSRLEEMGVDVLPFGEVSYHSRIFISIYDMPCRVNSFHVKMDLVIQTYFR
jgi:hypothetical protein